MVCVSTSVHTQLVIVEVVGTVGRFYRYCTYCMYVQWNPSNPDTLGPESTVLIIKVSSFQGLRCTVAYYSEVFGSRGLCPHWRGVPNSGGWIRGVPLYVCVCEHTLNGIGYSSVLYSSVLYSTCQD